MSDVSMAGITSNFVDSEGDGANFLADVGETVRLERAWFPRREVPRVSSEAQCMQSKSIDTLGMVTALLRSTEYSYA